MSNNVCQLVAYGFMLISLFVPYWITINGEHYGPILKIAADGSIKVRQMAELMFSILVYIGIVSADHSFHKEDKMSIVILLSLSGYYFSLLTIVENASIGIMPIISIVFFLIVTKHRDLSKSNKFCLDDQWCKPSIFADLDGNKNENMDTENDYKATNYDDIRDLHELYDLNDPSNDEPEDLNNTYKQYMMPANSTVKISIKKNSGNNTNLMPNYDILEDYDNIVLENEKDAIAREIEPASMKAVNNISGVLYEDTEFNPKDIYPSSELN